MVFLGSKPILPVPDCRSSWLQGRHVISVNLSLEQVVFLPRTPPVKRPRRGDRAAPGHAAEVAMEAVYSVMGAMVNKFIEDFFRANPKPGGK